MAQSEEYDNHEYCQQCGEPIFEPEVLGEVIHARVGCRCDEIHTGRVPHPRDNYDTDSDYTDPGEITDAIERLADGGGY